MDKAPAEKERELKIRMQQAELELFTKLPPDLRFFFSELLRLARLDTSLDDLEHYETTRLTLGLRRGLRELGQRLVRRGILDQPMDIFFAHAQQIEQAVRADRQSAWNAFSATIRRQKDAYLAAKAAVEFSIKGYPVMEMDGGFEMWKQNDLAVDK